MVLITQSGPDTLSIGSPAPNFKLKATDGMTYSLDSFKNSKALVISFTCNHCPYAQAYDDRLIALAREFMPNGVSFVAINPNDAQTYPDDSFENMKKRAAEKQLPYSYLVDETQEVAKAYGAVCTPHIFVVGPGLRIAYEGRIDDNWKNPDAVKSRDLRNALEAILADKPVPVPNTGPMGCSIKWKA
jgi:peroxiredoxin